MTEPFYPRLLRSIAWDGAWPLILSPAAIRLEQRRLARARTFFWRHRSHISYNFQKVPQQSPRPTVEQVVTLRNPSICRSIGTKPCWTRGAYSATEPRFTLYCLMLVNMVLPLGPAV
jgi:hypothetical protein